LLLAAGNLHKGGDGSRGPFFACFEGGAALDKEPSIERVHKEINQIFFAIVSHFFFDLTT
jgi:hypothetical protein